MSDNIFFQISIILGIAVSIAFVMRLLRQPLIAAYIIAGLIAGPLFLNLVKGSEEFFHAFAKFGIVLLLFIVGLSLNFDYLKKIGRSVLTGGLLQFFLTALLSFIIVKFLGLAPLPSIFLAIAVSFSSTIIVTKLLSEKRDSEAVYGRFVTGILLVQDIIAMFFLVFLTNFQSEGAVWYSTLLAAASKGILLVGVVFLMARYLLPKLMDRIARSGELLFIFTVAWCFGIASLVYIAGFCIEIGAVIAGISLGASSYQSEICSRIRPLRDFFIVLFFVVLGSELQLGNTLLVIGSALILSLFVIVVHPLILYFVMRWLNHTRRSSVLASVTAAQVSEFGFILVFLGQEFGYLRGSELTILTIVALITIVISSYLITYNEQIYHRLLPLLRKFGRDKEQKEEKHIKEYPVWVVGYHRIGWKLCEALAQKKIGFAVIDFNPDSTAKLKRRNIPAYFGDAADVEFLETLPLEKAKLIVLTIPEPDDQKTFISHARHLSSEPLIIGNLYHNTYLDDLYEAGADYVMMPHLLGGLWISEVLKHHPWNKKTFIALRHEQKEEMKLRYTMGTHR